MFALVAQWIEHLTTDQKVGGSSPSQGTMWVLANGFRSENDTPSQESCNPTGFAFVAQGIERWFPVPKVAGSIPVEGTFDPGR